jgi:hypothetical protein
MIKIFFEVGGKSLALETAEDPIERAILKSVAAGVHAKLDGIVCVAHGKPPEIHVAGEDLRSLKFGVSGCCDEMKQRAVAAIG